VQFGRQGATPTLWSQSAENTLQDPVSVALSPSLSYIDYGGDGQQTLVQSSLSIAQASHSADGDYLRVSYPVVSGTQQTAMTGLVRVGGDESMTPVTGSFVPVLPSGTTGSVLYPTLIEADRITGPSNGDERPPVVLFWVETTKTPPAPAPSDPQSCVHGPFGKFLAPTDWTTTWPTSYDHHFADVNGGGKADLVGRSGSTVKVALSNGSGFAAATNWTTVWSPADMQLADVNGGGKADLVGRSGSTVKVGLSNGGGFAAPANWTTAWTPTEMQLADVSGDGRADLVGRSGTSVMVGKSNGSGFAAPASWTSNWGTNFDLHLADVDGDGRADIIGKSGFDANGLATVQVALSTGTGFAAPTQWTIWGSGYDMQFADVNGDGRADAVGRGGTDVKVLLSTGVGSFGPSIAWAVWDTKYDMQLGDVSGDGRADAVGRLNGTVRASLSTTLCDWGSVSVKATVFRGASRSPTYTITTVPSTNWRGNGDYVHGAARYQGSNDRFFLHWYNENGTGFRMPAARLLDVVR
jgi:hypothetical protein